MDYFSFFKFWLWDFRIFAFYSIAIFALSVLVLLMITRYFNGQVVYFKDFKDLQGNTVVMTAGTEGVGKEAALEFVQRGARVIIGCSDMSKGEALAAMVASDYFSSGYAKGCLIPIPLDVSSMQSVRKFCEQVNRLEKKINLLCLTHSTTASKRKELTEENLERTMSSNYFGQFLTVILLFKTIKSTPGSRIITSVSRVYNFIRNFNPADINFEEERYTAMRSASLSMLCLVLFSKHFARLASKYNIRVNCFTPGFVSTSHYDQNSDVITNRLGKWAGYLVGRTPHQGAQTLLFLAMAENDLVGSGGMFSDCKSVEFEGAASDEILAQRVYETTEKLLNLSEKEKKIL